LRDGEPLLEKEFYKRREQTFLKHFVLEKYLERLAFKIGMSFAGATLNYVDGFSGPWQHTDEWLKDTSPFIAIEKLRNTRAELRQRGRQFNFRCLFIEKEHESFQKLQTAVSGVTDAEVKTLQGEFENLVPQAADFASEGRRSFGFFFIDPTGWTGYPMSKLRPLFGIRHSELLINFMTSFIDRFVDSEDASLVEGFRDLFGDETYRESWTGLVGLDKEDAIVKAYCSRLKKSGNYAFVGSSVVLDPNSDQTYYHLVYATHHPEGMRVFREVESKAYSHQTAIRSGVAQEKRLSRTGMQDLFDPEVLSSRYDVSLLDRYHNKAKDEVRECLEHNRRILYDKVELLALSFPLTSAVHLKEWIEVWKSEGNLKIEGLKPMERVAKPHSGHYLVWQ
jgi:three-Cys-motif partner protein